MASHEASAQRLPLRLHDALEEGVSLVPCLGEDVPSLGYVHVLRRRDYGRPPAVHGDQLRGVHAPPPPPGRLLLTPLRGGLELGHLLHGPVEDPYLGGAAYGALYPLRIVLRLPLIQPVPLPEAGEHPGLVVDPGFG